MAKSIMQKTKECYITGSHISLHEHHIYGGAYRRTSEKYGCKVWLTSDLHNMSPYGVHGPKGHELNALLKAWCQEEFISRYDESKFMEAFHKDYIEAYIDEYGHLPYSPEEYAERLKTYGNH